MPDIYDIPVDQSSCVLCIHVYSGWFPEKSKAIKCVCILVYTKNIWSTPGVNKKEIAKEMISSQIPNVEYRLNQITIDLTRKVAFASMLPEYYQAKNV